MKRGIALIILLLVTLGWLGFGTYHLRCKIYGTCGAQSSVNFDEGVTPVRYQGEAVRTLRGQLRFARNNAIPVLPATFSDGLPGFVQYIDKSPEDLLITAYYDPAETAPADYDNMGQARAAAVADVFAEAGIDRDRIKTRSATLTNGNFSFGVDDTLRGGIDLERAGAGSQFAVMYNGKPLKSFGGQLAFQPGEFQLSLPDNVRVGLQEFSGYLNENEDKDLEIIGLFRPDEPFNAGEAGYQNLGLARANSLKDVLTGMGVRANRIVTLPKSFAWEGEVLQNPFEIKLLDAEIEAEGESAVAFDPKNLYFATGSDYVKLDDELRSYISRAIRYLNRHPDKKLQIIGHTDNVGQYQNNVQLGQERADIVAQYFAQLGLAQDQIETSSLGPDEPIASNDTDVGRAQNRRAEIRVE